MPLIPQEVARGRLRPGSFIISPASPEAMGLTPMWSLDVSNGPISRAWPAANRALFFPFRIDEPRKALSMFVYNGATASGNLDLGVYDAAGNRLISKGTTAQTGTSVLQLLDITDTWLPAGVTLYAGLAMDGTTGTAFAWAGAANIGQVAATGLVQSATSFVLPSSVTYAAPASNYLPLFGVSFVATY